MGDLLAQLPFVELEKHFTARRGLHTQAYRKQLHISFPCVRGCAETKQACNAIMLVMVRVT
jgi:hypothetical protein